MSKMILNGWENRFNVSVQWRSAPVPLNAHHLTAINHCAADSFNGFNCHFSHIENIVVAKSIFNRIVTF